MRRAHFYFCPPNCKISMGHKSRGFARGRSHIHSKPNTPPPPSTPSTPSCQVLNKIITASERIRSMDKSRTPSRNNAVNSVLIEAINLCIHYDKSADPNCSHIEDVVRPLDALPSGHQPLLKMFGISTQHGTIRLVGSHFGSHSPLPSVHRLPAPRDRDLINMAANILGRFITDTKDTNLRCPRLPLQ